MQADQPSRTALGAALHRALHQELEGGSILRDPIARRILGADATPALDEARRDPSLRGLRLFIAVRARFAEDSLAAAVEQGTRQLVVLGAGLDTVAYRSVLAARLQIFEVDHPATQAWKRERLAHASIPVPRTLRYVPVDFEHDDLGAALNAAGFDERRASFFTWLGVVPYLTGPAVFSTLRFVADLPGGAQIVFDYANPPQPGDDAPEYAAAHAALQARVAALGEHFRSQFETAPLHTKLTALGFCEIEDLGPASIRRRYFSVGNGPADDRGGHVVRARTPPRV